MIYRNDCAPLLLIQSITNQWMVKDGENKCLTKERALCEHFHVLMKEIPLQLKTRSLIKQCKKSYKYKHVGATEASFASL